jgi:hypothetical protein
MTYFQWNSARPDGGGFKLALGVVLTVVYVLVYMAVPIMGVDLMVASSSFGGCT